jgi:ribosomal protein RSM22 (predicted rRNA methylase)
LFSTRATNSYELVTASYVFSELKNDEERAATLRNLWRCTQPGGVLVIVEPGTPIGFAIIKVQL